jgi:hypothetical protein
MHHGCNKINALRQLRQDDSTFALQEKELGSPEKYAKIAKQLLVLAACWIWLAMTT